jgi:hypothetical protein
MIFRPLFLLHSAASLIQVAIRSKSHANLDEPPIPSIEENGQQSEPPDQLRFAKMLSVGQSCLRLYQDANVESDPDANAYPEAIAAKTPSRHPREQPIDCGPFAFARLSICYVPTQLS